MELIASTVNSLISKIAIFAALAVLMSTTLAQTAAIQRTVEADGPTTARHCCHQCLLCHADWAANWIIRHSK